MATHLPTTEVEHWAHGYASWGTTLAVVDDSGNGDADGIADGDGSNYSANGDPLRTAFLQSGSDAATIRVEGNVDKIGSVSQQDRKRPAMIFSGGSSEAVWYRTDSFGGLVAFSLDEGILPNHYAGMMHWIGMEIQINANSQNTGLFSSTAGSPERYDGKAYQDARIQDVAILDCNFFGGWDQNTDTGPTTIRASRHYRVGMMQLLGASMGGFKREQCEYHSQLRGVYRAQASEFYACGRSAIQIVARGGEADGKVGYGKVVIESVRAHDVGAQSDGFAFGLKGRNDADLIIRDVQVAQACNPNLHSNYRSNFKGALEFSLSKDVESDGRDGNPERVNWRSVLIENCVIVRGTAFNDPDSGLVILGCCGRIVDVRNSSIHEYSESRPAIELGRYDIFNPNGGQGELKVDLFRFDVNNDVVGKIDLYDAPGVPLIRFQTYAEFLTHIDGLPGFEVYDSNEDGGNEDELLTINAPQAYMDLRPSTTDVKYNTSGGQLFLSIQAPIGDAFTDPEEVAMEISTATPVPDVDLRPFGFTVDTDGTELSLEPTIPFVDCAPAPDDVAIDLLLAPPFGELRLQAEPAQVLAAHDTSTEPPPPAINLSNPLLGLFPPGLLTERCDPNSTKWQITKAWDTALREIEGVARSLIESELDPSLATLLLPEWMEMVGLPDRCIAEYATSPARQRAIATGIHRMHGDGGLNEERFLRALELFGFPGLTITYPRKTVAKSGTLSSGDQIWGPQWNFVFEVHASAALANVTYFRSGQSRSGDSLLTVSNTALECLVERFKPAHTLAVVVYDDCSWNDTSVWDDGDTWDDC